LRVKVSQQRCYIDNVCVAVPSNQLDGQTGELRHNETTTESSEKKNSRMANGDAAVSEKLKTPLDQQTVLTPLGTVGKF